MCSLIVDMNAYFFLSISTVDLSLTFSLSPISMITPPPLILRISQFLSFSSNEQMSDIYENYIQSIEEYAWDTYTQSDVISISGKMFAPTLLVPVVSIYIYLCVFVYIYTCVRYVRVSVRVCSLCVLYCIRCISIYV